jgi:hypothetical protein
VATIDLCSLSDVRAELELPAADTTRDTLIGTIITGVSRALHTYAQREFKTETSGSTTRRFMVPNLAYSVDLAPYDLRSVTSVVIHPETSTSTTLTATTEYQLHPITLVDTYQTIRVSPWVASMHVGDTPRRFGYTLVDVTSTTWGFASVPDDVKRAAIIATAANLDRRLDAYDTGAGDLVVTDLGLQPARTPTFFIPTAALALVGPYRRNAGAF